jgi:hypothetical protein
MADWRNRLEQIINKFKFQLNAKGVDNLVQLKDVFLVSLSHSSQDLDASLTFHALELRCKQERRSGQA